MDERPFGAAASPVVLAPPRSVRVRAGCRAWLDAVALAAAVLGLAAGCGPMPATDVVDEGESAAAVAGCINSGTEATINAALQGPGASAVLCPGTTFRLSAPVRFTAANQRLYTQGLPTGITRALLQIVSPSLTQAINGNDQPGLVIQNVRVDGNRGALGYLAGPALIVLGGSGTGQTLRDCAVSNTRSWSSLQVFEGSVTHGVPRCQGATIANNDIGPAGTPDGYWADGISLACGNSTVVGNRITDATDGAIVVFGAPGSLVANNIITARSRTLLGGINLVDYAPTNGSFSGTRIQDNVIDAQNAFIKVGIAMGPAVWTCANTIVSGGSITGNQLQGLHFGYGYAVNGVAGFTISGNRSSARHVGRVGSGCGGAPTAPGPFQVQAAHGSSLQSEFRPASLTHLLDVTEPVILSVIKPSTGCGDIIPDGGLIPGQTFWSCDGRFRLVMQWDSNLVLYQGAGAYALFATNTVGLGAAQAIMQQDGNFVLYDVAGRPLWATNTVGNPGARMVLQNDGNLVIYASDGRALWSTQTGGR
jgi:hypothetical protein